jgi:ABC-type multidrug transport system fused ATPase/permease subunit
MASEAREDASLREGFGRLWTHVSPMRRRQLYVVFGLMLLGALAEIFTLGAIIPFLALVADPSKSASFPMLQDLFAAVGWSDPEQILIPATVLFALIAIGAAGVLLLLLWMSQRFVFELGNDLSTEVFRRTLYQPYLYHASRNSSDQIAAVNKVDQVVNGVLVQSMHVAIALIVSVFIAVALIVIDPKIALIAGAGFGLIYFAVTRLTRFRVRKNSDIWAGMQGKRVKVLQEGLGGIRDVIIDQSQANFINRYGVSDAALRRAQANNAFIGASPRYIIEACSMVLIAGIAVYLSRGPGGLVAAIPVLGALALGALRLLPHLQRIYNGWTVIAGSRYALRDVVEILELPIDSRFGADGEVKSLPFQREIVLDTVGFRYTPDRPQVLKDVSLSIPKGSRVGFVGKTGSGKSTIMDLIMGLMPPSSGEIRIDNAVLSPETVRAWQAQIAHVPQAIYLADTTVAGNIAFGVDERDIDIERVREAARQAELAEFIESLPEQYETIVGERGIRLSGGQRQRIGIARALYKRANVLVFDEATSALDNETEAAVMGAIERLQRDLTILIIAHRVTTVAMCDKVIKLNGGEVVAEGSYDAVVGGKGAETLRTLTAKRTHAL